MCVWKIVFFGICLVWFGFYVFRSIFLVCKGMFIDDNN